MNTFPMPDLDKSAMQALMGCLSSVRGKDLSILTLGDDVSRVTRSRPSPSVCLSSGHSIRRTSEVLGLPVPIVMLAGFVEHNASAAYQHGWAKRLVDAVPVGIDIQPLNRMMHGSMIASVLLPALIAAEPSSAGSLGDLARLADAMASRDAWNEQARYDAFRFYQDRSASRIVQSIQMVFRYAVNVVSMEESGSLLADEINILLTRLAPVSPRVRDGIVDQIGEMMLNVMRSFRAA